MDEELSKQLSLLGHKTEYRQDYAPEELVHATGFLPVFRSSYP